MPYCTVCGHKNQDSSAYCTACGQQMPATAPQPPILTHASKDKTNTLRSITMIIGIVAALLLLVGGCSGFVLGISLTAVEDIGGGEFEEPDDLVTTERVAGAGAMATFASLVLFIGALSAKSTTRFSFITLIIALILLIISLAIDPVSLFAFAYYITLLVVCANVVMMFLVYRRTRHA